MSQSNDHELTKLGAVVHYLLEAWPVALGTDSLGKKLQFEVGDPGVNMMGEYVLLGNSTQEQKPQAMSGTRLQRDETVNLTVVIAVRLSGASALEIQDRVIEIGNRIAKVQRVRPCIQLGGLANRTSFVPGEYQHSLAKPGRSTKALVRAGAMRCTLSAFNIRF